MIRKHLVVLVVMMCGALGALVASASPALADTACPTGTDTWYGPGGTASLATSGNWLTAANWSTGALPDQNCQAAITVPGTYTVTIQPTCIGTDDCDIFGVSVGSVVLGAPTGSQILDVSGQSSNNNGDTQNSTFLNADSASTVNSTGTLLLDSTAGGATAGGCCLGGAAQLAGVWRNDGVINVQDDDPNSFGTNLGSQPGFQNFNGGTLGLAVTNEPGGRMNLISGPVAFNMAGSGVVTNDGTITVDAAASVGIGGNSSNDGGYTDTFTNGGSILDNGSITDGGTTWDQTGGSISGNAVAIGSNALLNDSGGTGHLQLTPSQTYVNGTIPAGQTITVEPGVTLNDFVSNNLLVNDGTLVFQGNPPSAGQATTLYGANLENNGALDFDVSGPSDVSAINSAAVTNEAAGTIDLSGGTLLSTSNGATTNSGTVTVAPGTLWTLQGGSNTAFVNTAVGTVVPEIASATSVGTFQTTGGCCSGTATITAAGTLAPKLVNGFAPTANEEFPVFLTNALNGTFSTIGAGFIADYSQLGASSPYAGVVYRGSSGPVGDPTSTAVGCSPDPVSPGRNTTCTATVTDTAPSGAGTPSGTVAFTSAPTTGSFGTSGSCALAATGTAGKASCQVTFTPSAAGIYTITGGYRGASAYLASSGTSSLTATTLSAAGTIRIGSVATVTRSGLVGLRLSCAGATGARCTGVLTLKVRVRTPVTRTVRGHRRTAFVTANVRLVSVSYTLATGASETPDVKLSQLGVRILTAARDHRLSATASATPTTGVTVTQAVTLTLVGRTHRQR